MIIKKEILNIQLKLINQKSNNLIAIMKMKFLKSRQVIKRNKKNYYKKRIRNNNKKYNYQNNN